MEPFVNAAVVAVGRSPWGALAGPAVLGAVLGVGATLVARRLTRAGTARRAAVRGARLLLHLWPVVVLTAVYPFASRRMAGHTVGGVELTTFLLAVALTAPWLTQGVCMPLYRVLCPLREAGDVAALRRAFCAVWPTTFLQSVPVLLLCAVPLRLILHWSPQALAAYLVLLALDVLFAQALVLANLGLSRIAWALAWTGYALPVVLVPTFWYLPPLLGVLTQVVRLRRYLKVRPTWVPVGQLARDLSRGLLLGAVMWADKVFYFFRSAGDFPVTTVFLALLPAVLAYSYYFICLAPEFDASVVRLRQAMQTEPLCELREYSRDVSRTVATSVRRTALLGAVCVSITSWALTADRKTAALVAAVSVASWLFTMITVLCYKLDYIGEHLPGQGFGAAHVLACAAAFGFLPAGPVAYIALTAVDLIAVTVVFALFRRAWRTAEYTFFWQHALAW